MPKLDQRIEAWRSQLVQAGLSETEQLNELESHLREDIHALVASGLAEVEAFEIAVSRLGTSASILTEFQKIDRTRWLPARVIFCIILSGLLLLLFITGKQLRMGSFTLLFAHVCAICAGYGTGLLTGGLGICYVCSRLFGNLTPRRTQTACRALFGFAAISTAFIACGFVLGMIWAKQNLGSWFTGDPREIGGLCVLAWFIATLLILRASRVSDRTRMLMAITGNIVILLGWLGANAIIRGYGSPGYCLMEILIGIHLVLLFLGFVPPGSLKLRRHA